MSTGYSELIEALTIFDKYYQEGSYGFLHAEHDEIWAGPDPSIVSDEDKEHLKELGWNNYDDGSFHKFT